MESTPANTGNH